MAKGLTVIELIIVISILAILLSLAFPLFTIKKIDKASTMILLRSAAGSYVSHKIQKQNKN